MYNSSGTSVQRARRRREQERRIYARIVRQQEKRYLLQTSPPAPLQGQDSHYIDAKKFTALFVANARNRNRSLIAAAIYVIAARFVARYGSMPVAWREDAASDAAELGIRKIWHYQQNCRHVNAFSYFTKLIQNKVRERLRMERCRANGQSAWAWQTEQRRQKRTAMKDER